MADTSYPRRMTRGQPYRPGLPESEATSGDWEVLDVHQVTPSPSSTWHAGVYATATTPPGTVGQLRFRSSATTPSSVAGTGSWTVDSAGVIRDQAGVELITGGMNGGAPLALGTFGDPTGFYRWAFEGLPNFADIVDIWPGRPNGTPEQYPGGLITSGRYFSQTLGNWAQLDDKVWAMTGFVSPAAVTFGIQPRPDHWHNRIYRMNCHLVNGPNTWSGAPTVTAATSIPQFVTRVQELHALGLIVVPEDHDMTGTNPTLPAGLVSNPVLASSSVAAGPIRDMLDFYDALCTAFPGGGSNVWLGLPNEAFGTAGPESTDYVNFIVTMVRRIRAKGFGGIITLPLGRWAGDLAGLARGDYNAIQTTLNGLGVGWSLKWEWHNYGLEYHVAGTGTTRPYTWAALDTHLAQCQAAGRLPWMAEYGQAVPTGTGAGGTQDATGLLLVARHDTPLAIKYPGLNATWWTTADNTFINPGSPSGYYSLTLGPGQTETTTTDRRFPWWDVDGTNLDQLTVGGRAHWDVSHAVLGAAGSATAGVSPPVMVNGYARNIRLGFEGISPAAQLLHVEGRRVSGTGGLRLVRSRPSLVSNPPAALISGSLPTPPSSLLYGWEELRPGYVEPNPAGASGTPGKVLADLLGLLRRVVVNSTASLAAAKAAALPGDQIYVANTITGNGTNRVLDWTASDPSGTATNPIMITTAPGAWIDGGQVAGAENLDSRGAYIVGTDHIWLYGCNIRRANFLCMFNECNGTLAAPIRIWHCTFADSGHSMLNIAGNFALGGSSSYFDVRYCTFDNSGLANQTFGEAIYIGYGSTNSPTLQPNHHITIEINYFTRLTAEACDIKAGSQFINFTYNLIQGCGDHATPPRTGTAANVGFPGAVQFPGQTTPPTGWTAASVIKGNRWKDITSASTKFPDGLVLVGTRGYTVVGNLFTEINVGSAGLIVFYLDGNVPTNPGDTGTVEVHNNTARDCNSMNAVYRVTNAGASQPALLAIMNANSNSSNNVRSNSPAAATGANYSVTDAAFVEDGTGYPGSFSAPAPGGALDVVGADTTAHWTVDYAGQDVVVPVKPGAYQ
jgi:hypothetical protein